MPESNVSLVGNNYFLCGPYGRNLSGASDREFAKAFQHPPGVHHAFVAIGEDDCYFTKYYNERTERFTWSWSLSSYGGLDRALDSLDGDTPEFVSLGSDGYYFMRTRSGRIFWNLPDAADEFVENADPDDNGVKYVWLGTEGSYVAQKESGHSQWNLRGNYGSLEQSIRTMPRIRTLGLNLENDRSYFVVFDDGSVMCNPVVLSLHVVAMEAPSTTCDRLAVSSAKDWDHYREVITELYIKRNMSLPRLMSHMNRDYGFRATEKMYKLRFTEWNLKKNMTKSRSVACMRITGSSQMDTNKLKEYYRRQPEEKRQELLETLLQPLIGETPLIITAPQVSLTPPADLLTQEYRFHLLNTYVRGSSEVNRWPRDAKSGFKNEDNVPAWCSSVMSASLALREEKEDEATKFLQHFIKQSDAQLTRQDPLIFTFIYTSVLFFATSRPGVAQWLLNSLYNVSENLPWAGSSHPLRLLLQVMLQLGPTGIVAHAKSTILAYINMIYEALGKVYPIIQDMMSDTIWRLLRYKLMGPEEVATLGRGLVLAAELQNQHRCKDHINLKMQLADAYLESGKYSEARRTAEEIKDVEYKSERMMPSLYMLLSRIDEAERGAEGAIESALRSVVASMEVFGKWSDWTVNSLDFYYKVLKRAGRVDEARRVVQDRDLAIEKLCDKLEDSSITVSN
ncbi:hypothetical protein LZL87_006050 [Fusarium oxysporum]|nr:hypothetical protein LZL87_006050 [Fusarium oxysporum]